MKIAVVGTGAMGSVYAALLAAAGNEVWAIDTWSEHVAAIREHGLRLEGASGERTVPIDATADPAEAGPCDLVIVATKARDVAAAADGLGPLLGPATVVLTIQNGLGAPERIAAHVPRERILIGVAGGFGASLRGPGHAHHNGMELMRFGEMDGPAGERVERIAELWRDAGFNVRCYDDIEQLVWEKLVCNCTFSGPCTILRRTIGEVMDDPEAWAVARGCAREAYDAGRARGVRFSYDDPERYVAAFGAGMPAARPSMLLDHLARRRSEIDAINGAIPGAARAAGLAAPVNETVSALVRALESEFD